MFGSILLSVATVYAGVAGWFYLFQSRFIYYPERAVSATPRDRGLDYEEVFLATEDGVRVHGWYVPACPAASAPPCAARAVVLYFHGNAGNVSHRLERVALFHRLGLSVFIIDYRGYGRSEGEPSEEGTYRDAMAAWRYLRATRKVPPQQIVVFGRSLGASIASWLAMQEAPRALIVESGFTSVPEFGAEAYPWLPVKWLSRFRYATRDHLGRVRVPVLVVHSRGDEIIPYVHGERLFAAAGAPKRFLEIRGGHNDGFLVSGEQYVGGLDDFLRGVGL